MKSISYTGSPTSHSAKANATRAKSLTLLAMSLGFAVVQLDVTIVNIALTSIGTDLGGTVSSLQWVVSSYTFTFASLILTAEALGDRIDAKQVFIGGFTIFTAGSLACGLAPSMFLLIICRSVQGIGATILVPNSLALLNHVYHDATERGRAVGTWAAGASMALTIGPLAGGALIAVAGWRSIFLVNIPVGFAGLWITWCYADETPCLPGRELDLLGQIAAIGSLGCLAGAIIEGGSVGWQNYWIMGGITASLCLGILFVIQENRTRHPMLPLTFFQHISFTAMVIVGFLVNAAFYGLISC